ncbi:MAG: DUF4249 domain-containing protein [Bacteroidales bacterium]|nr:DUF4249 domain-containing protein [Bacteroidales bacterium]
MKTIIKILPIILMVVGCTEKIDIDLGTTYTRLVVEGYISTDTGVHWVELSKTTDYYKSEPAPKISGAEITLSDSENNSFTLTENSQIKGRYETPDNYFGVPGRTYKIEIELQEEINEKKDYEATCELRPVAPIDSIRVQYNSNWEAFEVLIYALEPPTTDFYAFQVIKNGVLLTDTIDETWISDDRYFNGNYTNGVPVYLLFPRNGPDEQVNPGDTITLKMNSITKEYYNFIYQLQDQTFEYRNPLFSGPPANVQSNISNEGSGFFATYSCSYSTTVYQ